MNAFNLNRYRFTAILADWQDGDQELLLPEFLDEMSLTAKRGDQIVATGEEAFKIMAAQGVGLIEDSDGHYVATFCARYAFEDEQYNGHLNLSYIYGNEDDGRQSIYRAATFEGEEGAVYVTATTYGTE